MELTKDIELTLTEQAFRKIRHAIIACEINPGHKLKVEELSQQYQISSSPVREALTRLSETGFVESLDNKGFRSSMLTIEGIQELTQVRLLIETHALVDAIAHGDDQWEANVVANAHALSLIERKITDSNLALNDEWSTRHRTFHLSIYEGSPSKLIKGILVNLFDNGDRYRKFSALHRTVNRKKNNEHQQILKAVIDRDTEAAVELLKTHIQATESLVIQGLTNLNKAH